MREAGGKHRGADDVGGFAVADLFAALTVDAHGPDRVSSLTLPMQISSTRAGSIFILSLTSFKSEYTIKSRGVSFMPPFLAFVSGVRMAIVMTTSSGFFVVLAEDTMSVLRLQKECSRQLT
jgi:hypothetical protein